MNIFKRKKSKLQTSLGIGDFFGQTKIVDDVVYTWLHKSWGKGNINPQKGDNGLIYAWVTFKGATSDYIRNQFLIG